MGFRILTFLIVLFCTAHPATHHSAFAADPPVLSLDSDRYDFGELLSGEVVVRKVTIRNNGGSDLQISRFEFSCGCTIPRIELSDGRILSMREYKGNRILSLEAGAWASLEIEFTSLGRKDQVAYKMVIHSNDPDRRELTVPILARVIPAFALQPKVVRFGTITRNSKATKEVRITSLAAGNFEIKGFENLPPHLTFETRKVPEADAGTCILKLTLDGKGPVGTHNLVLKARVDSERSRRLAVPYRFTILPDVSFSCDGKELKKNKLNFGLLERGKPATKRIHVLNKNPGLPYNIVKYRLISQYDNNISLSLETLRPGIEYEILITVDGNIDARFFNAIIKLESEHPDLKNVKLDVNGLFR